MDVADMDAVMSAMESPGAAEAMARVERFLGGVDEQTSELLRYRWTSEFQADWKGEIVRAVRSAKNHRAIRLKLSLSAS